MEDGRDTFHGVPLLAVDAVFSSVPSLVWAGSVPSVSVSAVDEYGDAVERIPTVSGAEVWDAVAEGRSPIGVLTFSI